MPKHCVSVICHFNSLIYEEQEGCGHHLNKFSKLLEQVTSAKAPATPWPTVPASYNCQLGMTWEGSLNERLSTLGWPVGTKWEIVIIELIDVETFQPTLGGTIP